jgi:hypothetical protein
VILLALIILESAFKEDNKTDDKNKSKKEKTKDEENRKDY